jgi:glycosyltransferase involved in cell wall biosynthesis
MRIAQVAPLTEAVPPKLYGGTERVVHWLTEELVALGHDVTLFASGDSQTSAKLDATWPKALRLDGAVRDPNALHMVMLERVRQKCDDDEFDFLHFHLDYYPWSLFYRQPTPFVTTLHGRHDLFKGPRDLDLQCAAAAGAAGELGAHHSSRPAGEPADAATDEAGISRGARPHRAGKGRRSRH